MFRNFHFIYAAHMAYAMQKSPLEKLIMFHIYYWIQGDYQIIR